jgi:gamma-glutamyl hydrolase
MHRRIGIAVVLLWIASARADDDIPNPPSLSIAVYADPMDEKTCISAQPATVQGTTACLRSTYVQWLQSAGIRVVAMDPTWPLEQKTALMDKVNGLLFPGGSVDSMSTYSDFWKSTCEVYDYGLGLNRKGTQFLIWGTCQGFQMISACAAKNLSVVQIGYSTGTDPSMLPINLTTTAATSRFLGSAPSQVANWLTKAASTLNYHADAIVPLEYAPGTPLGDSFIVTSTNVDLAGREFVSTIEGRNNYNVFGVQWHPEWPAFDWSNEIITKTDASIGVSRWVVEFVRSRLKLNNHTWQSAEDLEAAVVNKYPYTYQGYGVYGFWVGGAYVTPPGASSPSSTNNEGLLIGILIFGVAISFLLGAFVARFIMIRAARKPPLEQRDLIGGA